MTDNIQLPIKLRMGDVEFDENNDKTITNFIKKTVLEFSDSPQMPIIGLLINKKEAKAILFGDILNQVIAKIEKNTEINDHHHDMAKSIMCDIIQETITEQQPECFVLVTDCWQREVSEEDMKMSEKIDIDKADNICYKWFKNKIREIRADYPTSPNKAKWKVLHSDFILEKVTSQVSDSMLKRSKVSDKNDAGEALMFIVHKKYDNGTEYKTLCLPYEIVDDKAVFDPKKAKSMNDLPDEDGGAIGGKLKFDL